MCFSATASFSAGAALSAAGVATLSRAKTRNEIPFASIPLLFGIQQTIEGIVWISFRFPFVNAVATYAYVAFSHVWWPIFVPLAVLLIERDRFRRRILYAFSFVGLAAGSYLSYEILAEGITARIVNHSIAYDLLYLHPIATMTLYLLAICGSCLVSSHAKIRMLGAAVLLSLVAANLFFYATSFSVWCFFAAILSMLVCWHVTT